MEYVVIEDSSIIVITHNEFDDSNITSYEYSPQRGTVTVKVISHLTRRYTMNSTPYSEYVRLAERYSVVVSETDPSVVNFVNNYGSVHFTAYLSDSLPNAYPHTLFYKQIKNGPIKMEFKDRIIDLIEVIDDESAMKRIMAYVDIEDYTLMTDEYIREQILERTGLTYDQVIEFLLGIKKD